MNLNLNIEDINEIITICGANNSGKTNVLRALEVFFKPQKYNPEYAMLQTINLMVQEDNLYILKYK